MQPDSAAYGMQSSHNLDLKSGAIVDHVHAGMTNPSFANQSVKLSSHLDRLASSNMILYRELIFLKIVI